MIRYCILFLLVCLSLSCKKENNKPQWDIDVYGPLLHATIGMSELIGDSSIETSADGAQVLAFDTLFSAIDVDSIYQIADTTIPTIVVFPNFPNTIPPNTPFSSNTNNIVLGLGNLQLKKAIIASGKIRLEIKNTLKSKIIFTYTIPRAIKNGNPFIVTASVDSASDTNPVYYSGEFDFSGYTVDLTGQTGNLVNAITYTVEARSDPNGVAFNVDALDTMINLNSTLVEINPYFVSGYLGQTTSNSFTTENIGIGGLIKNGTVLIDSVSMQIDIINYIGADAQATISNFTSINNRTGSTLNLSAPSFINNSININRAFLNPLVQHNVQPSIYSIQLNHSNSNIKSILENLPDKINYDLSLNINPLGNISGSNDFVYSDKILDTRLQIKMPLRFAFDQLYFTDTLPFSISNATDFNPVGPLMLTVIAENGFPFNLNLQLFLLDQNKNVVDSILMPDLIAAAPYNSSYIATGTQRTEIKIPVDASRKEKILSVDRVGIRMKLNTPDYPQKIQLYSTYKLDLKMVADGVYSIR